MTGEGNKARIGHFYYRRSQQRCLTLLIVVPVILGTLFVLRGNFLVLAPVFGIWSYFVVGTMLDVPNDGLSLNMKARNQSLKQEGASRRWVVLVIGLSWMLFLSAVCWRVYQPLADRSTDATIAQQMASAERLFLADRYEEAVDAFKAIEVPKRLRRRVAERHHIIGVVCMRLERWNEAEESFRQAVEHDVADDDAYCNLARLSFNKGELTEMRQYVERALTINTDCPTARFLLAVCCFAENNVQSALVELHRVDAVTPPGHPLKLSVQELMKDIRARVSLPH